MLISLIVEDKNYARAVSVLIKMIEVDPKHEKSYSLLALCNQEADDAALAIDSFEVNLSEEDFKAIEEIHYQCPNPCP